MANYFYHKKSVNVYVEFMLKKSENQAIGSVSQMAFYGYTSMQITNKTHFRSDEC